MPNKTILVGAEKSEFLVEIDETVDTSPINVTPDTSTAKGLPPGMQPTTSQPKRIERSFPEVEAVIIACCKGLHNALTKIPKPKKFGVEFGIKFAGEVGVPTLTKASGECSLKVTIEWNAE